MKSDITATREIRVFLSSTFADMQAERDYLVKKIFPAIQSECRRRNVDFTVLDLRWGITEEEAKSGKVIEICMDEISRTRPFFIGLIGGRYGWVPTAADSKLDERLLNRFPHVREGLSRGKSITEMEMLYGVLDYPEQTYSHFFIRSLRSVPKKYLDEKGSEHAVKREKLKEAVRKAAVEGKCSVSDYSDLKQLGKMVTEALMNTLNTLYPAAGEMSRIDLIMSNHDAAVSRLRKIYVPRTTTISDSAIDEEENLLVLDAPAGAGKSAWAANYWERGVTTSPKCKEYIAVHTMLGSEINSAEMCRRALVYELCRNVPGLPLPELDIPDDQRVNISPVLETLSDKKDICLLWIVDGVDKLQNDRDRNLLWLNDIIDPDRKVVLLGADEEQLRDFYSERKDYSYNDLVPLSETEKMSLTAAYLRNFAKGLTASQRASIANDPELGNPGVLRIFLNEILQYGVYENLDNFMAGYIDAPDMKSFLDVVLKRVDGDFDTKTVSDFLNIIRLSFYGLPEEDITDFLRLKPVEWAAVFNALEEFVEITGGRIKLKPGDFSDVVAEHYPLSESEEKRIRSAIAGYSRKRFKSLARQAEKSEIKKEGIALKLFTLIIGSTSCDESFMPKISLHYTELFRQLVALKEYRKIIPLLSFNRIVFSGSYQQVIFSELNQLKKEGVSLARIVSFRTLLFTAAMDDNIILLCYKILIVGYGTPADSRSVVRKIRMLPISGRAKKKMLDYWNDAEQSVDFIDLWDENNFFDTMDDFANRNSELFAIGSIDLISKIHEKLKKTVANLSEEDLREKFGGLLYCDLAVTSARLGEFDEAKRYVLLSRQCENVPIGYSELVTLYADCLKPKRDKYDIKRNFGKFRDVMRGSVGGKVYLEYIAEAIAFPEEYDQIRANVAEAFHRFESGEKILGYAARAIGDILYAHELWKGAIIAYEEYGKLTKEESEITFASYRAGYAAFQLKEFDKAIEFLKLNIEHIRTFKGLKGWDENTTLRYLFRAYLEAGMIEEGIAAADEMISNRLKSKASEDHLAGDYNSLAIGLSRNLGKYSGEEYVRVLEAVIGYYKKAAEYSPDDRIIQYNLLTTYRSKFECGAMSKNDYLVTLRQLEELYQTNIRLNDDEQVTFCARELATAYYKLERWSDAVDIVEKHDGKDFLVQYDLFKAKIMSGNPEYRESVIDLLMIFMCMLDISKGVYTLQNMGRQLESVCRYVADFDLEDDIVANAEKYVLEKRHYEGFIVGTNYLSVRNNSEKMADLNRRMLTEYMREFPDSEGVLINLARGLLLPESEEITDKMLESKLAELRRFFVSNVGSEEELEIRRLENISLYELRKPEVMGKFVKDISDKPWRNRVLFKTILNLNKNIDSVQFYFRDYFKPLAPMLTADVSEDYILRELDNILYQVSVGDYGSDYGDMLYPMYLAAKLEPNAYAVVYYLDYIDNTQGIDAATRFYNEVDAGNKYGLAYSYATMLRRAGRMEETEKLVDLHLRDKDESYKYWVAEKIRLCRFRGEFAKATEYFLSIPEEDLDDEYYTSINFWVIASVFTYAGLHEQALYYLAKSEDTGGDYATGYPEYDPDSYGDKENGVLLNEGETDEYFNILLRSVIYFRMGNEKLGFEVFRTWEEVTEKLIESNAKEIELISLRELELARVAARKGDRQQAVAHYEKARMLVGKAGPNSFCHAVFRQFDEQLVISNE